jgi:inhibitor of cysteine peptidase
MKIVKPVIILSVILAFIGGGMYLYSKLVPRSTAILKLNVGNEFIIMLPSNRTTGYEWQIDSPLDGNKIEQLKLVYVPDKTGLAGSGGKEEWRFKALTAGKSNISFKYVRPWERGVPPAEKKAFDVEIKK